MAYLIGVIRDRLIAGKAEVSPLTSLYLFCNGRLMNNFKEKINNFANSHME